MWYLKTTLAQETIHLMISSVTIVLDAQPMSIMSTNAWSSKFMIMNRVSEKIWLFATTKISTNTMKGTNH